MSVRSPSAGTQAQLLGAAQNGFPEIDGHLGTDVGAPLRGPHVATATRTGSPEEIFEIELDVAPAAPGPASDGSPEYVSKVESTEPACALSCGLVRLRVEPLP